MCSVGLLQASMTTRRYPTVTDLGYAVPERDACVRRASTLQAALNATDFFLNTAGQPKQQLRYNNFGFNFSGPIIKDRIFFFYSEEWRRERRPGEPRAGPANRQDNRPRSCASGPMSAGDRRGRSTRQA